MRQRSILAVTCLAAAAFAVNACNLIFSIEPGEPAGSGGAGPDGGGTGGNTGGTSATTSSSTTSTSSSTGTGGTTTTPCTPSSATCEGAVLRACDENGMPRPDVTCDAIAACDAAAGKCVDAATLPRLAVGTGRACAIEDDAARSVRCWGINNGGIFIPGDTHLAVPTAKPIAGVTGVRQLTVGSSQACALQDDGGVICWGSNDSGETGVVPGSSTAPAKVAMPAGLAAVELSATHRCSCARLADGTVACWGQEDTGCFGNASQNATITYTPTVVPGVAGAVQIRVGSYDTPTCARLASQKLVCWGIETTPKEIPGADDVVDFTISRGTVILRSASKGLLWSRPQAGAFTVAMPYGVLGNVTALAGGDAFCALRDDGSVLCTLTGNPPPPQPTAVPNLPAGKIVEIAAGYSFNYGIGLQCLRLEGTPIASRVYCWGDDYGYGLGADAPESFRTPVAVPGISTAESISTSHNSTTAVLTDGSVSVWGQTAAFPVASSASPKVVALLGTDNAAASTHDVARRAYVVKKTGALLLLDTGTLLSGERLLATGFSDFKAAQSLSHYDLGLRTGGLLYVYGDDAQSNDSGIFGNGSNTITADTFANVTGLGQVTAFAAHGSDYGFEPAHACVITGPSGGVSCWGNNDYGEVGSGPTSPSVNAPATVTIPNGETAVSIAVGARFSCAATSAGHVFCWGANSDGQLGIDGATPYFPTPLMVPGITNALGVTAREAHACAWLADETAVCWGTNYDGELGDGTLETRFEPVPVVGLDDVAEISAGPYHACARNHDKSVRCWGSSYSGQIGTGVVGVYASPQMVVGL